MFDKFRDVITKHLGKRLVYPWSGRASDPIGQLIGPDQIVAAYFLATRFSNVKELSSIGKVENVPFWLGVDKLIGRALVSAVPDNTLRSASNYSPS